MAKNAETFYKGMNLLSSTEANTVFSHPAGLLVSSSTSVTEYEQFKKLFRADTFGLTIVLQGELKMKINLQAYTFTKDHLILTAPNALKQVISLSKNFRLLFVIFTTSFLNQIGLSTRNTDLFSYFTNQYSPQWKLEVKDVRLVKSIVQQMKQRLQSMNSHMYGKEILNLTFFTLAYEVSALSGKYTHPILFHVSRKEDLIIRFANLVCQKFKFQRNVQEYARQLNITPKYLTETVKEISGKSAGEVIDDFVILEAKALLDNAELSISQVAEKLQFSDQSFFGKYFKRNVGMSPKQYRQSHQ